MNLMQYLRSTDWPTVWAAFGSQKFFMALGTCAVLAFLLGVAALGSCITKCVRREGSMVPFGLGLGALVLGIAGYLYSWHSVNSLLALRGGPITPADDMAGAASQTMVGFLFCAAIFLACAAGSGLTLILERDRKPPESEGGSAKTE